MKKRILLLSSAFLAATIGLAVVNISNSTRSVSAGRNITNVVDDNFDDPTYKGTINKDKWTDGSNNRIVQAKGLVNYIKTEANDKVNCIGENVFFGTKEVVNNIKSVQFDYKLESLPAVNQGRWIGLQFLTNKQTSADYKSDVHYESVAVFRDNTVATGKWGGLFNLKDKIGSLASSGQWVTIKIDVVDANNATISAAVQGGKFFEPAVSLSNIFTAHNNFKNAQVGFMLSGDQGEVDLDNFSVTYDENGEEKTINTTFEGFDMENDPNFRFVVNDGTKRPIGYTLLDLSNLYFKDAQAGDYILTNLAVADDDSVLTDEEILNASFTVNIPSDATTEVVGFTFGINLEEPTLKGNNFTYEIGNDSATGKAKGTLRIFENGAEISATNNVFTEDLTSDTVIKTYVKKNGEISIKEVLRTGEEAGKESPVKDDKGEEVTFPNVGNKYVGGFAINAVTAINNSITVDDVVVNNDFYYIPVTRSVTHTFDKDYWGQEKYEDFYLTATGGTLAPSNGRLKYTQCSDGTFFGSAHQYDQFICDFKVTSIKADMEIPEEQAHEHKEVTVQNKWIGIDLSREDKELKNYGSYVAIYVDVTRPVDQPRKERGNIYCSDTSPIKPTDVGVTYYNDIPTEWFTAIQYKDDSEKKDKEYYDEHAVCIRYVSDGGSLTLYVKTASQMEFLPIAKYSNLKLQGYFTLCCTGFTNLEIDDFSMANTSTNYTTAETYVPEPEIIEEKIYIDDPSNVDTNLDKEIKENYASKDTAFIVMSIVFGSVAVLSLGGIAALLILRKKKHVK